jgi:hypothetical protein
VRARRFECSPKCCRLQPDLPQAATLCAPGELALFERKPRGASVVAVDECPLLVLEEQNFASFVDCLPSFVRRVEAMRNYAQHQARSSTFAGAPAAEAAGAEAAPLRRLPSLPPPPPLGAWVTSLYGAPTPGAQTARGRLQTTLAPPLGVPEPVGGAAAAAPAPMTARPLRGARVSGWQDAIGHEEAAHEGAGELVQSSAGFTGLVGLRK